MLSFQWCNYGFRKFIIDIMFIGAVSAFKILLPRFIVAKSLFLKKVISVSLKPPSGPIKIFISSAFLFLYLFLNDWLNVVYNDFVSALPYLIFLWVLLFWFSKILWINSYKYITVHRASIFICLYPIFTIIYNIFLFKVI